MVSGVLFSACQRCLRCAASGQFPSLPPARFEQLPRSSSRPGPMTMEGSLPYPPKPQRQRQNTRKKKCCHAANPGRPRVSSTRYDAKTGAANGPGSACASPRPQVLCTCVCC